MANGSTNFGQPHDPALWRWAELLEALALQPEQVAGTSSVEAVRGLAFDSRRVQPGDLFIALPGDPGPAYQASETSDRDGHNYVDAAQANGAVCALTHDGVTRAIVQLPVTDTLVGLRRLARYRRQRSSAMRIAITGSSGKTTAKTLLAAALEAAPVAAAPSSGTPRPTQVHASQGSFNNHLGVPLSLASMPREAAYGVFEIGTNHPGEIEPLSQLVAPDVAVLLNVHAAHVGNFAGHDDLNLEKLAIANGLSKGGVLVVEDEVAIPAALARLLADQHIQIVRFGTQAKSEVRLLSLASDEGSVWGHYQLGQQNLTARIPGGGKHRALTLAAVLAVLQSLALPLTAACNLPEALVPQGRGNRHDVRGVVVLDDSYNANPQSMAAALQSFGQSLKQSAGQDVAPGAGDQAAQAGRNFALLGDMLELGSQSQQAHAGLVQHCSGIDGLWLVGSEMRELAQRLPAAQCLGQFAEFADDASVQGLVDTIAAALQPGDRLLVKASKRIFWVHDFVHRLLARLG